MLFRNAFAMIRDMLPIILWAAFWVVALIFGLILALRFVVFVVAWALWLAGLLLPLPW